MLFPICPTCGSLLSSIQLPYQRAIKQLCEKYNIDQETLSHGTIYNKKFNDERVAVLNTYTDIDNICCRMRLLNFSDLVRLVG